MCCALAENLPTFYSCPETLQDTQIKGNGLINLACKISKRPNIQYRVWVLVTAFNQICSVNWRPKAEQKNLKSLNFSPKGTMWKVGTKGDVVHEETIKKEARTLYKRKEKMV